MTEKNFDVKIHVIFKSNVWCLVGVSGISLVWPEDESLPIVLLHGVTLRSPMMLSRRYWSHWSLWVQPCNRWALLCGGIKIWLSSGCQT